MTDRAAYMRAYKARNKERIVAKKRVWENANRARIAVSNRKWRKNNPVAVKAIRARWRQKNRSTIRIYARNYMKQWRQLNGERITSAGLKRLGPDDSLFKVFQYMHDGYESYYAVDWNTPADILMAKEAA